MKILLALPTYNGEMNVRLQQRVLQAALALGNKINTASGEGSLLANVFNMLWCFALNSKDHTHFLMVHSDITPMHETWITKLLEAQDKADCDILSVIVPLKHPDGVTSTAIGTDDEFGAVRRITMHEVMQLPETFDAKDAAKVLGWKQENPVLLPNTGMMLVRMDKRAELEQMFFTINDKVVKQPDGTFRALVSPEDWNFGRQAARLGLKVCATRAVQVEHIGRMPFPNYTAWGHLKHDQTTNAAS